MTRIMKQLIAIALMIIVTLGLELGIESSDYDFIEMAEEITQYCYKNQVLPKVALHE